MTSCQKRMRELSKVIGSVTEDHEISVTKGNHIQVIIRCGEEKRKLFSGKTPSDHRSLMNFKSTVKRAYQEMRGPSEPRF
jgi:hypothetical protein|nr:hypothetical protein [Neorhizobium tomejilense]